MTIILTGFCERRLSRRRISLSQLSKGISQGYQGLVSYVLSDISFLPLDLLLVKVARVTDSVTQWYTGEKSFSDVFLGKVLSSELGHNIKTIAASIFAATVSTAALYSKAIVHVVDFFLHDDQKDAQAELFKFASTTGVQSDAQLYKYAREALRKCNKLLCTCVTYHVLRRNQSPRVEYHPHCQKANQPRWRGAERWAAYLLQHHQCQP